MQLIVFKILLSSVFIFASRAAENTCATFRCGGITQPEGQTLCTFRLNATAPQVTSQTCNDEGQFCNSFHWEDPSQATTNGTCGNEMPPQKFPPPVVLVAGKALPGDFCNVTEDCFNSNKLTPTCDANICVPDTTDDSACNDARDCPMTHHCDGNRNKKCVAYPKTGEVCTDAVGCLSNAICAKVGDETELKCVEMFSIENGNTYVLAGEGRPDPVAVFPSSLCAEGHAYPIGTDGVSQCRRANRNKEEGVKGLARDEAGAECTIITHVAPEVEKADTESEVASSDPSKCGFNKDEKSYCAVQYGDKDVLDEVRNDNKNAAARVCHKQSGGEDGSYCAALKTQNEAEGAFKIFKTRQMLASAQQSANVMNNDRCVAETIMADFWQGNFDSAYTAGIFAAASSLLVLFMV